MRENGARCLGLDARIIAWIPRNLSFRYIHCTGQFTPKMKANAEPRLLSSLVWIDSGVVVSQHRLESFFHDIKCNWITSFKEFMSFLTWGLLGILTEVVKVAGASFSYPLTVFENNTSFSRIVLGFIFFPRTPTGVTYAICPVELTVCSLVI